MQRNTNLLQMARVQMDTYRKIQIAILITVCTIGVAAPITVPYILYKKYRRSKAFERFPIPEQEPSKFFQIMESYKLNEKQAKSLQVKGLRAWMLQGDGENEKSNAYRLPHDVSLHIATYVAGLSTKDTRTVYAAVCENTHRGARKSLLSKFSVINPGRSEKLADLDARYSDENTRRHTGLR